MARKPTNPSVDSMEFTLNFKEDMGLDFDLNNSTKIAIGNEIVKEIRNRTRREKRPFEGTAFAPYSEKYAEKKGVSVDDVDLTLLRDMLDSISITDISQDSVTIGFDSSREIPKAFNHHTGDTVPERPFFGVEEGELDKVARRLRSEINTSRDQDSERRRVQEETRRAEEEAIRQITEDLTRGLFEFG